MLFQLPAIGASKWRAGFQCAEWFFEHSANRVARRVVPIAECVIENRIVLRPLNVQGRGGSKEEGKTLKAGTVTIMMIDHDNFLIWPLFRHPFSSAPSCFWDAPSNFEQVFTRASAEGFIWMLEIVGPLTHLRQRPSGPSLLLTT